MSILKQGEFVGSLDCGTTYGYELTMNFLVITDGQPCLQFRAVHHL